MPLSPRSAATLAQIVRSLEQLTMQVQALSAAGVPALSRAPAPALSRAHSSAPALSRAHSSTPMMEYAAETPPKLQLQCGAAIKLNTSAINSPLFVVFDLETNGLGKTEEIRICQIGAQALDADFKMVARFNEFVNPLAAIDPNASAVNGINAAFVNNCDAWDDVGDRFNKWLQSVRFSGQSVVLLAHNGKRFDARILAFEHYRHKLSIPVDLFHADTLDVFKKLFPGEASYALGKLYASKCGKSLANAHTADADVEGVCTLLRMRDGAREAIDECQESFSSIVKRCLK